MHNPEIEDAFGAADGFLHAMRMGIESCKALNGEGKDYAAFHLLVDAAQAEINKAITAFGQMGKEGDADTITSPSNQTLELLASFQDKDRLYRKMMDCLKPGDKDPDAEFKAKEDAQYAFLYHPSKSLADVRLKAQVALEDEDVFDSLRNCGLSDNECVLRDFLHSILGEAPVDNPSGEIGDNGEKSS